MSGFPFDSFSIEHGTMPAMVLSTCRWKAGEPLLCEGELRLTGAETCARIGTMRDALARQGIGHGSTVALLGASSVALAITLFAAAELGAICCFIHAYEREDHNAAVLRHIEARLLIAGPQDIYRSKGARIAESAGVAVGIVRADATAIDFGPASPAAAPAPRRSATPDDAAMLLLSSGTTGKPKAILHTHRSLLATATSGPAIYGRCSERDSVAVGMQPSFAAWVFTMLPFFAARARICFAEWTGAEDYLALLAREKITVAALVPTVWRMVVAAEPKQYDLSALQVAFFSGEPGSPRLIDALAAVAPEVRTAYLASEIGCACGIAGGLDILAQPGKAASVGRPVPNADLRVVDPESDTLRDVAAGEIGEIAIRGASLARGYWKQDELTAARFVGGWWRSGDLGLTDADGCVFFKGRIDNRINSGGIKIHAEEVEAALLTHPDIATAAVVGEPDAQWGERVVAHVVSRNVSLTAAAIGEFCATAGLLSGPKIPKAIYFHDRLPTGPTNKLYRQALRQKRGHSDVQ
ncbi:MAG: acyl--CoA ligase [Xanthobacteraceae bacterium]|nr:acyl--CoA ligase [Xanthobacteraceae bacterium]